MFDAHYYGHQTSLTPRAPARLQRDTLLFISFAFLHTLGSAQSMQKSKRNKKNHALVEVFLQVEG